MRIAIATDQDFVASGFGCCPACTIVDIEDGKIRETFIIPNPGLKHEFWAELCGRNAIRHLIVGKIGAHAQSVMNWWGIEVTAGVEGSIDDVVRRFTSGDLRPKSKAGADDCAPVSVSA